MSQPPEYGREDGQQPGDTYDEDYWLGAPCEDVFQYGAARREAVVDMGRRMAELTIPTVMPPSGYKTGDNIPGNNQSLGAQCVNTLASKLMFQSYPPGLPMLTIKAAEYKIRQEIQQDPSLWANILLAFMGLEETHRDALLATPITSIYTQYLKLLLVVGNGAWKHTVLECPTYYTPHDYVVRRDRHGQVKYGVTKDSSALRDLDSDTRKFILSKTPNIRESIKDDWVDNIKIYTGIKLVGDEQDKHWQYWQEYDGELIPDTDLEADFEIPPIRFDWVIPAPGQDWGPGYCEEYRGDLYAMEALASAGNDGAAIAALMLMLVAPGSMTSVRQIREAKNLSVLPGRAEDITMFRSDKTGDLTFVSQREQVAAQRLTRAFLLQSSVQRSGERVTKEEIVRLGNELNEAMGGIYGTIAQTIDRPTKLRFMRLNEERNKDLPPLPDGVAKVYVTSGVDAMGQSNDAENLLEFGQGINQVFGPQGATQMLMPGDFATRYAAAKGITHPSSLVKTDQQQQDEQQQATQAAAQRDLMSKAAGPVAGAAAGALAQQYQQANPPQPPAPTSQP